MSLTAESVVVITGAGSGIGRALAVRLSNEPIAGIAIADIDADALEETRALASTGPLITTHRVDVGDREAMRLFADDVAAKHGGVTHVINNAGVALRGKVADLALDEMKWLIDINFWGVVYGTKFFLPFLEKEPSAHIVNISSVFGFIAPPGNAPYAASKFAVRGFTESLRHELEGTNIAVSVVHPGGVSTNIVNSTRMGEALDASEEDADRWKNRSNKASTRLTSADRAARIIIKGIKKRNPRIIVGVDSRILGLIARIFPKRYLALLNLVTGGRFTATRSDHLS